MIHVKNLERGMGGVALHDPWKNFRHGLVYFWGCLSTATAMSFSEAHTLGVLCCKTQYLLSVVRRATLPLHNLSASLDVAGALAVAGAVALDPNVVVVAVVDVPVVVAVSLMESCLKSAMALLNEKRFD